jgi:hypothetical protein
MQIDVDDEGKELLRLIYTDGTGRFPKQSRTGMNYIMVLAENDSDAILVEAMRNRSAGEMVRAYSVLIKRLHAFGIFPTKQVLDNEISQEYKDAIASFNIAYELVPPHNHERNKAERAIQTFKNHFVSILCGADKDFPLYLWSDILRQAEHTYTSYIESVATIVTNPSSVGVRVHVRPAQLRPQSICAARMQS